MIGLKSQEAEMMKDTLLPYQSTELTAIGTATLIPQLPFFCDLRELVRVLPV